MIDATSGEWKKRKTPALLAANLANCFKWSSVQGDLPKLPPLFGRIKVEAKMGVSKNSGTPKWIVYNGKPYQNGWFGGKTHHLRKHPNVGWSFWGIWTALKRCLGLVLKKGWFRWCRKASFLLISRPFQAELGAGESSFHRRKGWVLPIGRSRFHGIFRIFQWFQLGKRTNFTCHFAVCEGAFCHGNRCQPPKLRNKANKWSLNKAMFSFFWGGMAQVGVWA